MKTLEYLEREHSLNPIHRILLSNNGSMTTVLEALFGKIKIRTDFQNQIPAGRKVAAVLRIEEGEKVNERAVCLFGEKVYVYALSYAPLSRLKKKFKDDIMRMDTPIGKILSSHQMESRREILGFESKGADNKHAEIFGIPKGAVLLQRMYNIIHSGKPLINITETFPLDIWEGNL